jgi:peptide/nickel transport system permease protein
MRNKGLFVRIIMVFAFFLLLSVLGPLFAPHDPYKTNIENILAPPDGVYPLGTDNLGRCVFSRLLTGAGVTLGAAFVVEACVLVIGLFFGVLAGYKGGLIDALVVGLMDILLSFPGIILVMVIAGILGQGLFNVIAAFSLVWWVEDARIARSITRSLREKEFVIAAQVAGSSEVKIIFLHILPFVLSQLLVRASLNVSSLIISISSMSFIGIGVRPPLPEWGSLLSEGRVYMRENSTMMISTIVCIMFSSACFLWLGEFAREKLDPKKSYIRTQRKGKKFALR